MSYAYDLSTILLFIAIQAIGSARQCCGSDSFLEGNVPTAVAAEVHPLGNVPTGRRARDFRPKHAVEPGIAKKELPSRIAAMVLTNISTVRECLKIVKATAWGV